MSAGAARDPRGAVRLTPSETPAPRTRGLSPLHWSPMFEPRPIRRLWAHLARGDRWKLHLGVGAGSVLVAGVALAPQAPAPVARAPQEAAVPLLREELQRRDAGAVFRDVHRLGEKVGEAVVKFLAPPPDEPLVHPDFALLPARRRPRLGYGLVVSADGDVLSHASAIGREVEVDARLANGVETRARIVAYEGDTGLVLLRLATASPGLSVPLAGGEPVPGAVVAAVTRTADGAGPLAQPVYVASDGPGAFALAAFSEGLVPGTPLFTLDASAIAVVGETARTAWPAARAVDRLSTLARAGRGVPATIGVRLQAVGPRLRPFASGAAVIIADVDEQGSAARAGVRAGDGLRAVNRTAVSHVDDAVSAIATLPLDETSEVVVARNGKHVRLLVQASPTLAPPGLPAVDGSRGRTGPPAGRLFSPSALADAGVPADARVLTLDGRAMSERAALTYLKRARGPHLLYLAHSGQHYFAVAEARP